VTLRDQRRRGAVVDDARSEAGVVPPPAGSSAVLETDPAKRAAMRAPFTGPLNRRRNAASSASVVQGFGSLGLFANCRRKPDIDSIAGDEDERDVQRVQPLGDGKAFFMHQPDVEQRKIRRAIGNQNRKWPAPRCRRCGPF